MIGGFFSRLKDGLSKSSAKVTQGIADIVTKRRLDDDALDELEEVLITADLGVTTAASLVDSLRRTRFEKEVSDEEVRTHLAEEIAETLSPYTGRFDMADRKPYVIVMAGVNGAGKTTTMAKLGALFQAEGKKVMFAACDTFRAAAVEQLQVWGARLSVPVMTAPTGADAAALAFDAYTKAVNDGADVLMIDTAGRLQNKAHLMEELKKLVRVLKKKDESLPHTTLLVLDATVGQNAHEQVRLFDEAVSVDGLVVTKLDGSAKGGVVVALTEKFKKPLYFIGVGEAAEDLKKFDSAAYAAALMGVDRL